MLKKLVKSCLNPIGIDIVKYPISTLAQQLRPLFASKGINLVLDVGASDGGFARFLRRQIRYGGKIVSFEPTPATFQMLTNCMSGDRNWRGYDVGVSDEDDDGILNTYGRNYDFNSVLPLKIAGANIYNIDLSKTETQAVKLRSISSLWNELTEGIANPVVYLKTDTQGHDAAVLRGAASCFQSIVALQSEVPALQIYDGMRSMGDTINSLNEMGYIPLGFHSINRPKSLGGLAPEYDVIFVKRLD